MPICPDDKGCGGCGTIWKNGLLITCPKCNGFGRTGKDSIYYYKSEIEIPMADVHQMCDPNIPLGQ